MKKNIYILLVPFYLIIYLILQINIQLNIIHKNVILIFKYTFLKVELNLI